MEKSVDKVLTTKEAHEIYGVAVCTIRQWMDQKLLSEGDYRKSGGTWIMDHMAFLDLLRKKNLLEKKFEVEGKTIIFQHRGLKTRDLQLWYENDRVKTTLTEMPYANTVIEAFRTYGKDSNLKYKHVLICKDEERSDNWFYQHSKTWVVTLRFVLDIVAKVLATQAIDLTLLESYLQENRL
ncbi:monoamine oxidase [Paenibacillus sp. 1182]|uniref:helix-turn-helix domain-containing protein n=1 Tax=Paenibacillus sp. 1182 TaxID=2806565 RepID=UPI001AE5BC93|nr:helix-turn-helix domain-containing protein [Paenibacillus sp. 1182]MBP1308708.1 monoamine oxidase [Paenibacillus sp. 1182]